MSDQKTSMIFSLFSSSLSIAMLLLSAPLQLGMAKVSLAAARGQKVSVKDLFFGFGGGRFWKSVGLSVSNSILIVLWSFVLIIPGIVKTFEYALSFYVLADHPEMGINEARRESMSLMTGNKGRLFRLELSWIGWGLLCVATLGILMLWVLPAAQICLGAFYCDTRLEDLEGNAKTSGSQNIKADPFQYFSRYSSSAPVRSNPPAPSEIAPSDNRPQPPEAGEPDAAETPLQNGEESLSAVATRTPLPPSDAGDGKNESEE